MKVLLCLSVLVGLLAMFLTMDAFSSQRTKLFQLSPACLQKYIASFLVDSDLLNESNVKTLVLTKEDLAGYDGEAGSPGLFLAILGKVFDVSKGKKHYGPGGGYNFFSGRDATRAFVSGDFTEKGLTDNIRGLTSGDVLGIEEWLSFYEKDYKYVGKVQGQFYDANGNPTEELAAFERALVEARKLKDAEEDDKRLFPMCNSEWSSENGGRVWCSTKSGGIQRAWVGVPRKYFKPGSKSSRCACVRPSGTPTGDSSSSSSDRGDLDNPSFQLYADCDEMAESCKLPN